MKLKLLIAALLLGLLAPAQAQTRNSESTAKNLAPGDIPRNFRLSTTKVQGKLYYRTFRVTSKAGLKRISDKSNSYRFFQGDGQYGVAFYLFRTRTDERKFAKAEATHGAGTRNLIAEVLLPKAKFDNIKKNVVHKDQDWSMQKGRGVENYQKLRSLRMDSHILVGKWADSPHVDEPVYEPINGAKQLAVVQRGMPSILNEAIIRLHETYKPNK